MSKYNIDTYDASPIGSMDNYMRFAIANELAEANRLRRMILQMEIDQHVAEDKRENWLGECVDKA